MWMSGAENDLLGSLAAHGFTPLTDLRPTERYLASLRHADEELRGNFLPRWRRMLNKADRAKLSFIRADADRLPEFDAPMQAKFDAAHANQSVLRFVAKLVPPIAANGARAKLTVSLQSLPNTHAFAHVALTDNIVQFQTARYCANPLIVRGPGAGPEVTAAGVFADVLRIASALGAKL